MSEATCSIEGCNLPRVARGWCTGHYDGWRRKGDPLAVVPTPRAPCSIKGCDRPHVARGWCRLHYERWKNHGDPLVTRPGGRGLRRKPIRWAVCQNCGKTFEVGPGSHGQFCNRACFIRAVTKICPQCGKTFQVMESKADKYRCCSRKCSQAAALAARVIYECKKCGREISRVPSSAPARFCSYACMPKEQLVTLQCERCSQSFTLTAYRAATQRFCGNRCSTISRIENGPPIGYMAWKLSTGYRTDIEAMVERVLIALDIPYLFEHKVGRYLLDFALPEWDVALECDGWYHRRTMEKDQKRDLYLSRQGWTVLRLPDQTIRDNAELAVVTALDRFHGIKGGA